MLIIFFFVCSSFLQCVLLFPYTTLFRSRTEVRVRGHRHPERQARALHVPPQWRGRYRPVDTGPAIEVEREGPELVAQEDRKSTRLNSSHLGISYAVFCLKKKKKKKINQH